MWERNKCVNAFAIFIYFSAQFNSELDQSDTPKTPKFISRSLFTSLFNFTTLSFSEHIKNYLIFYTISFWKLYRYIFLAVLRKQYLYISQSLCEKGVYFYWSAKKTLVNVTWILLRILNYFVANPTNWLNIVTATSAFKNDSKFKLHLKQSLTKLHHWKSN